MQKPLSLASLLLLSSLLCGCFGSQTSLSTLRMEKPEVSSNRYQTNLKLGTGWRQEVDLTSADSSSDWVSDLSTISLDSEYDGMDITPFINVAVTVAPKLEISLGSLDDVKIGLKYQFSGLDAESAGAGNFSQAVTIAASLYLESDSRTVPIPERFFRDDTENPVFYNSESLEDYDQQTLSIDVAYIMG